MCGGVAMAESREERVVDLRTDWKASGEECRLFKRLGQVAVGLPHIPQGLHMQLMQKPDWQPSAMRRNTRIKFATDKGRQMFNTQNALQLEFISKYYSA